MLTTQYLDEADHLASHVAIIDQGRVVASGTPAELKRRVGGQVLAQLRVDDDGRRLPPPSGPGPAASELLKGRTTLAPPKGGKAREVPLPAPVAEAIAERLRVFPAVNGLVFTTRERPPPHRGYYTTHVWKPALRSIGVEPTRANGMHALRHHYASVLLDGGASIRDLAEYLGHADPGFTRRVYTHLMPSSEDRAREIVEAAFQRRAAERADTAWN